MHWESFLVFETKPFSRNLVLLLFFISDRKRSRALFRVLHFFLVFGLKLHNIGGFRLQSLRVYRILPKLPRGARQLGWASCLVLAGRVTLAGETTFSYINTLARLPLTTHGISSVTYFRNYHKSKINSAKPTLIEWMKETQTKIDIWGFEYWNFMNTNMNNYGGSTLTRLAGTPLPHINAQ